MHARSAMIHTPTCLHSKVRILYFSFRPRYPPSASLPSTRRKNAFPRDLLPASKRRSRKRKNRRCCHEIFQFLTCLDSPRRVHLVRRFLIRDGCTQREKRSRGKGKYFYHTGAHLSGLQRRDAFCFSVSGFPPGYLQRDIFRKTRRVQNWTPTRSPIQSCTAK